MPDQNTPPTFTGERFLPGIQDPHMEQEHYQRYYSILPIVKDKLVLDAACGEGYGSSILATAAKKVTGIDIDQETIHHASDAYATCGKIEFFVQSAAQLSFPDSSIDVVVSFETIEHLPEEMQQQFLEEIARVLKKDGILIMSTPNKKIYSDQNAYQNEFHIKEFYKDEFLAFLHRKFQNIQIYHQYFEVVSMIDSGAGGGERTKAIYQKNPAYQKDGKYLIAVAGNESLPKDALIHIDLGRYPEYETKMQRILHLQQEVEERNSHLKDLDKEIDLDRTIIREQEHTIQGYQKQLAANEKMQQEAQFKIAENVRLLANQEQLLKQQEARIKNQEMQITQMEQEMQNKQGHLEQLLEAERAYEREQGTWYYKLARKLLAASLCLFPIGSKRRRLVRAILRKKRFLHRS